MDDENEPMPLHFQELLRRIRSLDFESSFFCVTSGQPNEGDGVLCLLHDALSFA